LLKVIGVEGERLEGSEGDVTQDFVLINGPAFGAPNPKKFLSVIRLLWGIWVGDRFAWDCAHHQAFQELSITRNAVNRPHFTGHFTVLFSVRASAPQLRPAECRGRDSAH
jgi:hypothetical protein